MLWLLLFGWWFAGIPGTVWHEDKKSLLKIKKNKKKVEKSQLNANCSNIFFIYWTITKIHIEQWQQTKKIQKDLVEIDKIERNLVTKSLLTYLILFYS